ncbi:MAG: T9SS type A sorting domain-containing protein, partial [Candidatus Cloacimonetes bacterium]|nr:T9SS type A sorting domain-containing protein [Candidatus Cloacimonadota bacterium]
LPAIPLHTGLRNIYPNPFNPSTTISYQLEDSGQADISIYNARGQKVQSYSRHHATPGYFNLLFDGKDTSGSSLSSGVYHVVMISGKQVSNQKIVLLK